MSEPDPKPFFHYEPVSLSSAPPGFVAVIAGEHFEPDGHVVRPVVAWGVFHHTLRSEGSVVIETYGNVMEGVVTWRDGLGFSLVCAAGLGPVTYGYAEPDLDVTEVARQLKARPERS